MRLLLLNPSQKEIYGKMMSPSFPPLGLAYLSSYAKSLGHETEILDIDADKIEITDKIAEFEPDFIGLTATTPTSPEVKRLIKIIRKITTAKIIVGGIHATIKPNDFDEADHIIIGEGELALKDILEGTDEKYIKKELIKDLDILPFSERTFKGKYTYPDSLYAKAFPIMTSRGCCGLCTYCCTKQMYGLTFRYRSAQNVVDEIGYLVTRHNAKEIHIWDDNFILIKKRVLEIRDEMKKRNLKVKIAFPNGVRCDCFSDEIAKALVDMGTYSIAFGFESGNQEVLNAIKKTTKLETMMKATKIAKKHGLEVWGFFMMGLPTENAETIRDTVNFAKRLDPDIAKFHILKPFPSSQAYQWFEDRGLILTKDYVQYGIHTAPVHRLETLSAEELLQLQKKAYREFYFRPRIMFKQLLRMKSWNRFKLNVSAGFSLLRQIFQ